MKWMLFFILAVCGGLQAQALEVEHKVTRGETLWFLASLYYGNGNDYKKILQSNHFKTPNDMREGTQIKISDPVYTQTQGTFAKRYTDLWEKRERELSGKERMPAQERVSPSLVIPVEKILKMQNKGIRELPFSEALDPNKSAVEMANEELVNGSRESRTQGP